MEDFEELKTNHYVGYIVVNKIWKRDKQVYEDHGHILFSSEKDAQRCLKIMDEYKSLCRLSFLMSNTISKEVFIYDGSMLHTLTGRRIKYDDYKRDKQSIGQIEECYEDRHWGYMDEYVKLFGHKPRRPRSFLGSLLCCLTCVCLCTDDVCTKVYGDKFILGDVA
jgi:hypothetical protein